MAKKSDLITQTILPSVVLVHSILFIIYWLTNSLFYSETNNFLTKMLGTRLDYISICLWFAALVGFWSIVRIILYRRGIKHRLSNVTTALYLVVGLIFIVFFYGSFWKLFSESPVQVPRLVQMISYYRLILDTIILVGVAVGLGFWVKRVYTKSKTAGKQVTILPIIFSILVLLVLWIVAAIYTPDSVYKGELPAKPLLIAHRGTSMLAPENTIASAELAAELGVFGLETDIHISNDGKLFLLHDDTFTRTTDVDEVFPDRATDRAEYFSIEEATRLNAGEWFVERDPYGTIDSGEVSDSQIEEYLLQTVPTLADELNILQQNELAFIYDIKQPPDDQPYSQSFFEISLNEIHAAGIDPQIWVLAAEDQVALVRSISPEMKLAYGADYQDPPSADELNAAGYQIVNVEYGLAKDWIKIYQEANLWINLYTIDEPWQYSRLWLLGVDSTTSSNVHTLAALEKPVISQAYGNYLLIWLLIGLVGIGLFLGLTLPVYRQGKEKR